MNKIQDKYIVIYCGDSTEEELEAIQTHFFDNGYQWYTSKYKGERSYKKKINTYIITEGNEIYTISESTLNNLKATRSKVVVFNRGIEYLRYYKMKKIKSAIKS